MRELPLAAWIMLAIAVVIPVVVLSRRVRVVVAPLSVNALNAAPTGTAIQSDVALTITADGALNKGGLNMTVSKAACRYLRVRQRAWSCWHR
jgi:hypothetical protein